MTATDSTITDAARRSADEAYEQLPNTEPERSQQVQNLTVMPGGFYQAEVDYLADEIGREPTDDEESLYVSAWEERIEERAEADRLL
jgi:hypothetical protein